MTRIYRQVHDQYLITWLMKTYPWGTYRLNARLGEVIPWIAERYAERGIKMAGGMIRARCDALVILPDEVHIVEALVRPEWHKIMQLEMYESLFRMTPEYREHWHKPIRKILLVTIRIPMMELEAEKRGIEIVEYRPFQTEEYLHIIRPRDAFPRLSSVKTPEVGGTSAFLRRRPSPSRSTKTRMYGEEEADTEE